MPYDKLVDSAQLDNAITQTANAIRAKTGSAGLIDWNIDTGFADAIGSLGGGASGGNVSYQSGCRINSSGEQIAYDGYATSDYISCELNNVVYLLNIYMESGVENAGNLRIAFYDSNKVHLGQTNATGAGDNLDGKYEATDGSLSQFTVKSFTDCDLTAVKYFRLCSTKLGGDAVVIVSEAVGGSGGGDTSDDLAVKMISRVGDITNLPNDITIIGDYAFYRAKQLKIANLPPNLTDIGESAFYECVGMSVNSLPDTILNIGQNAFYGCTNIKLTTLPPNLTAVTYGSFGKCSGLALSSLPQKLTNIDGNAFSYCDGLINIRIPAGVKELPYTCFGYCKNLEAVTIEGSVYLHSKSFADCTNLRTVTILSKLTNYSTDAFRGCSKLSTFNVSWAEGEVAGAPWGVANATINYNYVEE